MSDEDEAFTDELEALSAIFGEDFTSSADARTCTVRVAECELNFQLIDYPDTAPAVSARPINAQNINVAEPRLKALELALKETMASLLGTPLIYETVLAAQEWLEEHPLLRWQRSANPPKQHHNTSISTLKRSGRANAGALSTTQAKAVPSLQIMCLTFLLQHASCYDKDSRALISDNLQYFCELSRGVLVLTSAMMWGQQDGADDGDTVSTCV